MPHLCPEYLGALGAFRPDSLSPSNQTDLPPAHQRAARRALVRRHAAELAVEPGRLQPRAPAWATCSTAATTRSDRRLRNISDKIAGAQAYYAGGRANLRAAHPRAHRNWPCKQNEGGLAVFGTRWPIRCASQP
ncbi:MAG: hypothetical protein WKG07_05565 [Hymenobacter sp.]